MLQNIPQYIASGRLTENIFLEIMTKREIVCEYANSNTQQPKNVSGQPWPPSLQQTTVFFMPQPQPHQSPSEGERRRQREP